MGTCECHTVFCATAYRDGIEKAMARRQGVGWFAFMIFLWVLCFRFYMGTVVFEASMIYGLRYAFLHFTLHLILRRNPMRSYNPIDKVNPADFIDSSLRQTERRRNPLSTRTFKPLPSIRTDLGGTLWTCELAVEVLLV
jgi:hypothetical protein